MLLSQVRHLLALGRHQHAAQRVAELLANDPQHVEALVLASQIAMADGGDALAPARQAHSLDPQNPSTAWQLGWALLGADEVSQAEALAQQAVRLDPDDPDNHELLAEVRWRGGDVQRALVSARNAVQLNPNDPGLRCLTARLLLEYDQPNQAREQLHEALRLDPEHGEAHRLLALDRSQMWQVTQVRDRVRSAARSDPMSEDLDDTVGGVVYRFSLLFFLLAGGIGPVAALLSWRMAGHGRSAVTALVVGGLWALVLVWLSVTVARLGVAEVRLGWRMIQHGARSRVLVLAGWAALAAWLVAAAVATAAPRMAALLVGHGVLLVAVAVHTWPLGFVSETDDPAEHPDVRHLDRLCFWGLTRQAVPAADRLVRQRAEDSAGWVSAGHTYRAAGATDRALQCAGRSLALKPQQASAYRLTALTLLDQGSAQQALNAAVTAMERDPEDFEAPLLVALALLRLGDPDAALENADLAVDLAANAGGAHLVRALCLEARGDPAAATEALDTAVELNSHLDVRPARARLAGGSPAREADWSMPQLSAPRVFSYLQGEALQVFVPLLAVLALTVWAGRGHVGVWPPAAFVGVALVVLTGCWWVHVAAFLGPDVLLPAVGEAHRHPLPLALFYLSLVGWVATQVAAWAAAPGLRWQGLAAAGGAVLAAVVVRLTRR